MTETPTSKTSAGDVPALQARINELEGTLRALTENNLHTKSSDILAGYSELMHLYDTAPIGIGLIDIDLRYVRVNELLAKINGVPKEDHIGRTVRDVIPGIADIFEPMCHEIIRSGKPMLNIEVTGHTQNVSNKPSDYLVSYIPIKNAAGDVCGISKIVQDVSAFKYGGIALRESEARQRAILAASLDPMVAIDSRGAILSASDSLIRVFGWRVEEVIGKNISMLMPDPYQSEHDGYLESYRKTGDTWILGVMRELRALRKDGTEFPCEVSVSRVDTHGGEEPLFAGIIRDISDRKDSEKQRCELENQLRQSQKMEAIGALAGGIAHDFNNLLTAIYGYTSLLKTAIKQGTELDTSLDGIDKAASQATSLTESLLTFSRKSPALKKPSAISNILRDTIKIVKPALSASIEININIPEDNSCWVQADASQIQQVFMNLAINARDAMPEGGTLSISCGRFIGAPEGHRTASALEKSNNVFIEFVDSGMGMSEEVRQRVFEPFFTTKPRGQGTGLGMSVVYGIVNEHKGLIEIESKETIGTTVRLLFPSCIPSSNAQEPQQFAMPCDGCGETILIVEDSQQVRAILTTAMINKGYHVIQATNGAEAVRAFLDKKDEIDLVVLDYELPKRSGLSCLEEFRKHRPSLGVIMMTGNAAFDAKAISGSTVELLCKPFRVDQLTALIHKKLH